MQDMQGTSFLEKAGDTEMAPAKMDDERKTYFVDRIEGEKATIKMDDGSTVDVDSSLLDPSVTEGSWIYEDGTPAPEKKQEMQSGIEAIRNRLKSQSPDPGGDIKL